MGVVRLVNAVFYAHHGVTKEEHEIGGRFEVDVSMHVDFATAAEEDNLSDTVDYEKVYQMVHRVVTQNKFYLIERLALLIAQEVLTEQDMVTEVEVVVRKPNPPVGGPCDRAEACYRLARSGVAS